jgi:hypothetical protein
MTIRSRGFGRAGAATLAAVYLLQATWLLYGGIDLVFPRVKRVAAGAQFRCASHGCGCDSESQARKGCCCFPDSTASSPEATPAHDVPVSAIEEARCAGMKDVLAQLWGQPALLPPVGIALDSPYPVRFDSPVPEPAEPVRSSPPDKVPWL